MKQQINWAKLVPVWDCYELMGLSPANIGELEKYIASPILIGGGGAGCVPACLIEHGYKVISIDSCREMIALALERGIQIKEADMARTSFPDESFATVIISTGVIDAITIRSHHLDELLLEADRLLLPNGKMILAYFRENPDMELMSESFGLNRYPSNNVVFFTANDVTAAGEIFCDLGYPRDAVKSFFSKKSELVQFQLNFVKKVGAEASKKGYDPVRFISENMGFKTFDLNEFDEKLLYSRFHSYFSNTKKMTLSDLETVTLIGSKK